MNKRRPPPKQRAHQDLPSAVKVAPARANAIFLGEPLRLFGGNATHADPKHGLSLFGPCALPDQPGPSPTTLRVGIIGDGSSVDLARAWIERCKVSLPGKDERPFLFPPFPGFEHAFRCNLEASTSWEEVFTPKQLEAVAYPKSFQQRVTAGVELFAGALHNLTEKTPRPDVVICALPDELLRPCGIEGGRGHTVRLSGSEKALRKEIKENLAIGQQFLLPFDEDYFAVLMDSQGTGEFYKRLKIRAMEIGIPVQISKTSTFIGGEGKQDDATRAWNFWLAVYHKAGGYPWRLPEFEHGTCYVGITFYRDRQKNLRTSLAQVFTHTGEGLVLRGSKIEWDETRDKTPHLNEADARSLLEEAIELYTRHMKAPPRRLVVHKSSRYWEEELRGFQKAAEGIPLVDIVAFRDRGIRFFRLGTQPPLRGTMVLLDKGNYLLYTKGYVPFLRCYPGPRVPRPLEIVEHRGPSTAQTICKEILGLTKMNWNTADYSCAMPITLDFSDHVGEILIELPEEVMPKPEFKWYR